MPTSQRPSRTWPGFGLRRDQPNRSAPSLRQRTSWRSEKRRSGFSGSTCVSFFARNAIGSMPSFSAISSIAISSAIRPGASPGARMALPSGRSSTASRMEILRFGAGVEQLGLAGRRLRLAVRLVARAALVRDGGDRAVLERADLDVLRRSRGDAWSCWASAAAGIATFTGAAGRLRAPAPPSPRPRAGTACRRTRRPHRAT